MIKQQFNREKTHAVVTSFRVEHLRGDATESARSHDQLADIFPKALRTGNSRSIYIRDKLDHDAYALHGQLLEETWLQIF